MSAARKLEQSWRVVCDARERSQDWIEARRTMITASDVSTVLGMNPYKTPFALWSEKVGLTTPDPAGEAAEAGLRAEPMILRWFADETSFSCSPVQHLCASKEFPFLGATCDAQVIVDGKPCPLELKTASERLYSDWEHGCASHYVPQIQTQMLVMGSHRAAVAVLIGGNKFRWCFVEPDPEMQARIIEECREFMRRVEQHDPPPLDGHRSTTKAIEKLYPANDNDKTVVLGDDFEAATREIEIWEKETKSLAERIAEKKNEIRLAMGDAERALLPSGGSWTWKSQVRKKYERGPVIGETVTRVLRRSRR